MASLKRLIPSCLFAGLTLTASVMAGSQVQAADFDFSGTFENDNDVLLFDFTVGTDSTITIFSSSWLYGEPPAGEGPGGFDPILALFDSTGNLITEQDDGENEGSTLSNGVSYNHGVWDSYFTQFLTGGNYTAAITQYDNFTAGSNLSAGFIYDDNPNFTFDQDFGSATQPLFNGIWQDVNDDDPRTNEWAFHILNVDQVVIDSGTPIPEVIDPGTPIPEPSSILGLLAFSAFGASSVVKRKQVKKTAFIAAKR